MNVIDAIASQLRLKHWVRNLVIVLPMIFAGRPDLIFTENMLVVFISFCLASSSIYVLNDLMDIEDDKIHPFKKSRPLASGYFSTKTGYLIFAICVLLFALLQILYLPVSFYVMVYFVLNLSYIFLLKAIALVDVSTIAIGFVLRIMAGGAAAGVFVSYWMIIITFLLTVSIGFSKRRADMFLALTDQQEKGPKAIYSLAFLDLAKGLTFSITLIAYILYSISPDAIGRIGSDKLYLTSLFVFLGILRYLQLSFVNPGTGSPIDVLWTDRFLQIVIILWACTFLILIYGNLF